MNWNVEYADEANYELDEIYSYIANDLNAPKAAERKLSKIMDKIDALDYMPMRYKIYDTEPWRSQKLRCFSVEGYVVFYYVYEDTHTVYISRIINGRCDLNEKLKKTNI
ncbi:MAG: type II toxin-antitoxin system RelE/ParE family toxin [Ruminococcus sp.]|nr:type II toxin-antitoxin system RelE/ParE family toxin [Ruminococcus sp.]